jgi:hypothetical protein
MITLSAKINLDYDKTVLVQSANIEYGDNHDSLHNIINKVASTPFVGDVPSQRNNLFYDEFDASQKTFWCKADRQTYSPQGNAYYNNTLCVLFRVAYFADFSYGLPYTDKVVLHEVALKNKWSHKVFYEYGLSYGPSGIGLSVDVYVPREFATGGEIVDPIEVFPEVSVYGTASRDKGTVGAVYEITVTTDKPTTSLTLTFDQENNYHPTSVEIDGATFPVRKAVFTTDNLPFGTEHKIRIYNWNSPRTKFFIYGISSHLIDWTDIDYRTLTSCDSSIFDRSDVEKPSWGIFSNTGNITFNDVHGIIEYFAEQQLLASGVPVELRLKNTLTGKTQKVGSFYTAKWNYDSDSREVSVSLKDNLEEWQDINVEGMRYNPKYPNALNLRYFYSYLYSKTPSKYKMGSFYALDEATQDILTNTYIKYPLLKSGNLWQQWNKICIVAQAHIFKNSNGTTMFVCGGGN